MSDLLGLGDEIKSTEKSLRARKFLKYSTILIVCSIGIYYGATYFVGNQTSKPDLYTGAREETFHPQDDQSSAPNTNSNVTSKETEKPSMLPAQSTAQSADDSSWKIKFDNENKKLRKQWLTDAYSLNADMAKVGVLIGKRDEISLRQAKSMDSSITGRAISLGILQGLPNAHETSLKNAAASTAKDAAVAYFDALGWIESCSVEGISGMCADANKKLNKALSLSQQLSQKIQAVAQIIDSL